jgi:nicotinate phosphoribosyltransferase
MYNALFTDLYELTMIQGYFELGRNPDVVFDMFFRRQPFGGGFSVFAGLEDLLGSLSDLRFGADDIEYLRSLGRFSDRFLEFLADFQFRGDLYAMQEGTIVFPDEPLIRIHAGLIEAQLIEGLLLNTINFQTLIATKAARVYLASGRGTVLEFGLRRAQGPDGALSASRAAFIGGAAATSNTLAGKRFGIPVRGTMAHSWVMAFESEEESFRCFADRYPDSAVLLIDTYDTLDSGIQAAIKVGTEMRKRGNRIGVRLDSGDLEYLSREVRRRLDEAGLADATITASNELNEEIISQLVNSGCPIDSWGVGTHMVTGGSESSLTGVYKLTAKSSGAAMVPTLKVSNQPAKTNNPGVKQVYRFSDGEGAPLADLVALESESVEPGRRYTFNHPDLSTRRFEMAHYDSIEPLLQLWMRQGERTRDSQSLGRIREFCLAGLTRLDHTFTRLINPHIYKVSLSDELARVKRDLVQRHVSEV